MGIWLNISVILSLLNRQNEASFDGWYLDRPRAHLYRAI
jgi:hypothetical protein